MSEREAYLEATRRWGIWAKIRRFGKTGTARGRLVGVVDMSGIFRVCGEGSTWEEAFADADRHATGRTS